MSVTEGFSSVGYCKPKDVLKYFEKLDSTVDSDSPTNEELESIILAWSDYIDRETGHAWRERQVVDEFDDLEGQYYYWAGKPIPLMKREIREFKQSKGDEIKLWRGGKYRDMVSEPDFTQGRDGDYWLDSPNGILYIDERLIYPRTKGLKVTYRYGHGTDANERETIPEDINMACAKLCAADLTTQEKYDITIPGGEGGNDNQNIAEEFKNDADRILERRREIRNAL